MRLDKPFSLVLSGLSTVPVSYLLLLTTPPTQLAPDFLSFNKSHELALFFCVKKSKKNKFKWFYMPVKCSAPSAHGDLLRMQKCCHPVVQLRHKGYAKKLIRD